MLPPDMLVACEEGRADKIGNLKDRVVLDGNEQHWLKWLLHGILTIAIFNICLFGILFMLYFYIMGVDEVQRTQLLDCLYAVFGVLILLVLTKSGDASKGNPKFYYI